MKRSISIVNVICLLSVFIFSFCTVAEIDNNQNTQVVDDSDTADSVYIAITDNYIEDFTSILLSDGRFILFQPDSLDGFYFMYDSLDAETCKPIEELGVCVYCDSLMRPSIVYLDNALLNISNYTSNSFDFSYLSNDTIIEYSNVEFTPFELSYSKTKASTSGGGFLEHTGNILSVIDATYSARKEGVKGLTHSLLETFSSRAIGLVDEIAGGLTDVVFSIYGVTTAAATGAVAIGVAGWAVGTLGLMKGVANWTVQNLMGDVTPNILDVSLNSSKQVVVSFDITDVVDASPEWPNYSVIYWKQGDGKRYRTMPERITENGIQLKLVDGLTSGRWGFKIIVFPERFNLHPNFSNYYSFDTKTLYLSIPPIDIKSVTQIWYNQDTSPIQFQYQVLVDYQSVIDKSVIIYNDDYGICVKQDGKIDYYSSKDNNGTSSPEEYLIPLNVEKEDFEADPTDEERMVYAGNDIIIQTYYHMDGYIQYGNKKIVKPSYAILLSSCPDENHPHMIDLGLSVKWACCNVGASTPEDYGGYYAWGETEAKTNYCLETYKFTCDYTVIVEKEAISYKYSKYNTKEMLGCIDNKTTLDPEDDVAHVKWGGSWRMPTGREQSGLRDSCTWTWFSSGNSEFCGVAGYKVVSNIEGYTDRYIFIPAAGYRYKTSLEDVDTLGVYWSSSLDEYSPNCAWNIYIHSLKGVGWTEWNPEGYRTTGHSVRPVCP